MNNMNAECQSDSDDRFEQPKEMPDYMNYGEVAAYIRVSETTLKRWVRQGIIPCIKIQRRVLFNRNDVMHCLRKHKRKV